MRNDHQLNRIEDILPDNICRSAERSQGVEVGVCHPDAERGVLLSESLSGGDGRDASHGCGRRRRVDEHVLVVFTLGGSRKIPADEFAQAELKEAGEERGY